MRNRKMALGLAAGLWLSVTGALWAEGLTDKEIHVAQYGPQSGPAATWGNVARGTGIFFKLINQEGGINGRQIVYHLVDDAYDPIKTRSGVMQLQEKQGIFAWVGGVGSQPGLAVKDYIVEKGVPWVGPTAGLKALIDPPQRNIFGLFIQYEREVKALCHYAVNQLRNEKIAIVYQNDSYGRDGLAGAVKAMNDLGKSLITQIAIDFKTIDIKPQILALQESGAEVALMFVSPVHAARLLKTAQMMLYAPQWMAASTCSDFTLLEQIAPGVFEGLIASTFVELADADLPLTRKYQEAFSTFKSPDPPGVFAFYGFGVGEVLVEGVKRCGDDLSRERLIAELEQLKDFKGVLGKVGYQPFAPDNPACREGMKSLFLIQCLKDGKSQRLTDWLEM